jgi:hypothetical protein
VEFNPESGGGSSATISTDNVVRPKGIAKRGYYNPVLGEFTSEGTPYRQQIPLSELESLPDQLYAAGELTELKSLADLVKDAGFSSWSEALNAAAMDPEKESRSWREYLQVRAQTPELWKEFNDRNGSGGGSSTTTTTNLSSRSEAAVIADENFRKQLGRTASKEEIMAFQDALNEQQRNNPSVTRSNSFKGGSTSVSSGGFDFTRFARQYAQSQPEFKDRYAAVKFMDALDKAISDPNSLDDLIGGS